MSFFKRLRSLGRKRDTRYPRGKWSAALGRPRLEALEDRTLLSVNPIVAENQLPGTPMSDWWVGTGDDGIMGYATDISVNHGQSVSFKVNDPALAHYHIDIYRMGYYQGNGARLVTTISSSNALVRVQPNPLTDPLTHEVDAGNWSVTATWNVPANAVSGIYFANFVREDTDNASQTVFVVRNDGGHEDVLFQTSDQTWEAYNDWGGYSLYGGPTGRAFAVSYNRPFDTEAVEPRSYVFSEEFPMVEWLEANGYDVAYFTHVDDARNSSQILNHKAFLSVGHDEYWSGVDRTAVENAMNAGVNLAFFSGNEMYWRTEYAASLDPSATPYRTIVCYKDSLANAPINPDGNWTGLWEDGRFTPPAAGGGQPQNALTGTLFAVNRGPTELGTSITVTGAYAHLSLWAHTAVANLQPNQSLQLGDTVLGYEWDVDADNGFRPAGLFDLSSTTQSVTQLLLDYGATVGPGTATHSLTEYRAASGALVFGAGTVQWSWGLESQHDVLETTPDINMEQATVNLLGQMGAQPGSLQSGLVPAGPVVTGAPTSAITSPTPSTLTLKSGTPVTITGTATAVPGSVVAAVEVSTDGGLTWHRATGTTNWTYTWTPGPLGAVVLKSRAVSDFAYLETPSAGVTVNVFRPAGSLSIFGITSPPTPGTPSTSDTSPVEVGIKFSSDISGFIAGIRFYKGTGNTGTHVGHLWDSTGALLASATFTNETASGWQQVMFASPVPIVAGQTYIASYFAPKGGYAADAGYFLMGGVNNGPLHALGDTAAGGQGVYHYGSTGGFPTTSFEATNYYVDVVLTDPPNNGPPTVVSRTPAVNATAVPVGATVTAQFTDQIATDLGSFTLTGPGGAAVAASLSFNNVNDTYTLSPSAPLAAFTTYTATLNAITDLSGNVLPNPVSWSFTTGAGTAPPLVAGTDPAAGAPGVAGASTVSFTFNEQVVPGSIAFTLKDSSNNPVAGTLTYDPVALTGTFTPTNPLNPLSGYTASVSGARDAAGNVMAAPYTWQFQTAPASYSLWNASVLPTVTAANDPNPIEVGVKIRTDVAGTISGVRFYKGLGNAGTHVADVWTAGGILLASAPYTSETAGGWQQVNFATPVQVQPNTVYIVSYYAPDGDYAADTGYFSSAGVNVGPLHALANGVSGGDGVYHYGAGGGFPTSSGGGTNYWVDAVFNAIPDTTPPEVETTSPLPNTTSSFPVSGGTVTATFDEPVQPGTVHFTLTGPSGAVAATLTTQDVYGAVEDLQVSTVATLTPTVPLQGFTTYTATITGATDYSGNVMAPYTWTFTTGAPVYSFWGNSATPAVASASDNGAVELGVKFTTDVPGRITGLRFYKGAANTGTHVGHLWAADGTLLATATFTNESATGWQVVQFSTPVTIAPNTVYVASYYAPSGGYAYTGGFFASAGVDSGPLHALANGVSGGDGVYVYGNGSTFPANSGGGSNYWVDAVFDATAQTTPPTVTATTPAANSSGLPPTGGLTATFSEPVQASTVAVTLTGPGNQNIPGTVTYSSTADTATFTPSTALAGFTTYTAKVTGATDLFGNVMAPYTWTFTTGAPIYSLWNNTVTPAVPSAADPGAVELGVKFRTDVAGRVTALRFYKGAANTGTHVGHLWAADGTLLATATFTNESATGWQQVTLSNPVTLAPNTVYVASYYAPSGGYAYTGSFFSSAGVDVGPLHALANGVSGGDGVYVYGNGSTFPANSGGGSNYWVDAVFDATPQATGPTVTGTVPAASATGVAPTAPLSATFSEPVQASTVAFTVTGPGNQNVAGTVSYSSTTNTATFTPSAPLAGTASYTVTVSGATDFSSNVMTPYTWTFTTGTAVYSLWPNSTTPAVASAADPSAVELGVKFRTDVAGYITGLRFYKGSANTGTHVGHLWTSAGVLLATATFTNESATGWQQVTFSTPVAIAANTTYVASYYAPNGGYSLNGAYFASSGADNGVLHGLANGVDGPDGLFAYGTGGGFPTGSYNASNYWVDVTFTTAAAGAAPPSVTGEAPAAGATGVPLTGAAVTASFSEAVNPASVAFAVHDPSNNSVAGTVSYNAATQTTTFTPSAALKPNTTYTVSVSAADTVGDAMASPFTWTFTTTPAWEQNTVAAFGSGTTNGTQVTATSGGGQVQLASGGFSDNFATLNAASWTVTPWSAGGVSSYTLTTGAGGLSLAGAELLSAQTFANVPVAGSINFSAAPYQHFGLATDLSAFAGNYWAVFGTAGSSGTLFARVNANGATTDVNLGALPTGFHTYEIVPVTGAFQFFVDGALKTTVAASFPNGTPLKIVLSSYNPDAGSILQAQWVGQAGSFASSVFDAGHAVNWGTALWQANVPAGTTLTVLTRSGNTTTPDDGTWSAWAPVANGGTVASPSGRYLQYELVLSTANPAQTPSLWDITFTWN